jgi:hypothetical protein
MSVIRRRVYGIAVFSVLSLQGAAQDEMGGADEGLLEVAGAPGLELGIASRFEQRALEAASSAGAMVVDIEVFQILTHAGVDVLPFLHLYGELGWGRVDLEPNTDGDGDIVGALGIHSQVIEFPIEESPVVGKQKAFSLDVDGSWRRVQSDFAEGDITYDEVLVIPSLRYIINRRGTRVWRPYRASGVDTHIGVAFSFIDGELGSVDVEEKQTVGFAAGVSARSWGNFLTSLRGIVYDEGDLVLSLGFHRLF